MMIYISNQSSNSILRVTYQEELLQISRYIIAEQHSGMFSSRELTNVSDSWSEVKSKAEQRIKPNILKTGLLTSTKCKLKRIEVAHPSNGSTVFHHKNRLTQISKNKHEKKASKFQTSFKVTYFSTDKEWNKFSIPVCLKEPKMRGTFLFDYSITARRHTESRCISSRRSKD